MYIRFLDNEEHRSSTRDDEQFSIMSDELWSLRMALRFLGFWHPPRAKHFEKTIHPLLVNLLFFALIVINICYMVIDIKKENNGVTSLILETITTLLRYVWSWVGHILVLKYFRSRNLEEMIEGLSMDSNNQQVLRRLKKKLAALVTISMIMAVVCVAFSMLAGFYLHYPVKWTMNAHNGDKTNRTRPIISMDNFVEVNIILISISDFYQILTALCLTWLMFLLYHTSDLRLLKLKHEYACWRKQAEDAIFQHYVCYDTKVRSSCEQLQHLFISHNILMVIITPLLFYQCVEIGNSRGFLDETIYTTFLLILMTCWFGPLFYAESMKLNEESFCNEINKFCHGYLAVLLAQENSSDQTVLTFRARREVNKLVSYLKGRKSGFLIGGYSFQTQLSMLSFYLGLLTFVVKIMQ